MSESVVQDMMGYKGSPLTRREQKTATPPRDCNTTRSRGEERELRHSRNANAAACG